MCLHVRKCENDYVLWLNWWSDDDACDWWEQRGSHGTKVNGNQWVNVHVLIYLKMHVGDDLWCND